ncbi:hypothetical protein IV36_GL001149 [Liquorilactobacillus mali]|uniref:Solute-binding protein family 3/N-terminal domain-containing protein n=2 Tax=Liquorilactobacillus mali TaxID=1618 RepID=A0A0R2FEY2_9LACO|nr:hypothetical protein IV36_GL001149 [Liquorilactobacillus mali]
MSRIFQNLYLIFCQFLILTDKIYSFFPWLLIKFPIILHSLSSFILIFCTKLVLSLYNNIYQHHKGVTFFIMNKKTSIFRIIIGLFICLFFLFFLIVHFHAVKNSTQEKLTVAVVKDSTENKKILTFNKKIGVAIGKKLKKKVILKTVTATTAMQNKQKYSVIIGLHKKSMNKQEIKHSLVYLYVPNELVSLKDKGLSNLSATTKKISIVKNIDYPQSLALSGIKLHFERESSAADAINSVMTKRTRAAIVSALDYTALTSKNIDYLENLKTNQATPPVSSQAYYLYINKDASTKKAFTSFQGSQELARLSFNILGQDYTKQ